MSKAQQPVDGFSNESAFSGTAFPRHLQENTVEYQLFIIDPTLKTRKEELARLETTRKESVKLSNTLLKDYIWQREEFKLEQKSEGGEPIFYEAKTTYLISLRPDVSCRSHRLR